MKKIKIDLESIFLLFLLIPFLKFPDYIVGTSINNLFDIYKMLSSLILLILTFKKGKISQLTICFIVFEFLLLFSTLINGTTGKYWTQITQMLSVIGIFLYCDYFIPKNPEKFLSVVSKYICFIAFLSSITMFMYYPHGMYIDFRYDRNYYFFGLDNIAFFTFYIGLIMLIVHSKYKYGKVNMKTYLFILFMIISYVYVNSTTAYCALIALFLGTILIEKKVLKVSYKFSVISMVLFCLSICLFGMQNYFGNFLQNVLGKSLTLTGRTLIWERSIDYIIEQPVFGYGLEFGSTMITKVGFNHIHNIFIENLYKGGIVLTFVYFFSLFKIGNKVKEHKKTLIYSLFSLFLFIFLFICQFDYYNDIYICFMIYPLLYYMEKFVEGGVKNENFSNNTSV